MQTLNLSHVRCTLDQVVGVAGQCEARRDCSVRDCGRGGVCVPLDDLDSRCYFRSSAKLEGRVTLAGSALGIIIGAFLLILREFAMWRGVDYSVQCVARRVGQ